MTPMIEPSPWASFSGTVAVLCAICPKKDERDKHADLCHSPIVCPDCDMTIEEGLRALRKEVITLLSPHLCVPLSRDVCSDSVDVIKLNFAVIFKFTF